MALIALWQTFMQQTSVRGASRIVHHQRTSLRLLWVLGFLSLLGITMSNVIHIVINYLKYEQVSLLNNVNLIDTFLKSATGQGTGQISYPSGCICNLNAIASKELQDMASVGVISVDEYVGIIDRAISHYPADVPPWALGHLKSYRGYFDFIGLENASKVSHQPDDFIVICDMLYYTASGSMSHVPCNESSFVKLITPEFFACYSISLDVSNKALGIPVGLSLVLHGDENSGRIRDHFDLQYDNTQIQGMRFALLNEQTVPDLWYTAVNLSPGFSNQVHVRLNKKIRLSAPYGDCLDEGTRSIQLYGLHGETLKYSTLGCQNACAMDELAAKCGCLDPALLATTKRENLQLGYCGTFTNDLNATISNLGCARSVKGVAFLNCHKSCQPDCVTKNFEKSASQADWPKKSQHLEFYKKNIRGKRFESSYQVYQDILDLIDLGNKTAASRLLSKTKQIENNFAKLMFYIGDFNYNIVEDTLKFSGMRIFSELGGALNLYIGINLVLAIELVELFYHLATHLWSCTFSKKQDKVAPAETTKWVTKRNTPLSASGKSKAEPLALVSL